MALLLLVGLAALTLGTTEAFVLPLRPQSPLRTTTTIRAAAAAVSPVSSSTTKPSLFPQARRWSLPALQSTAAGSSEGGAGGAAGGSNSETVLWLRGLSNTFDGERYQFKDISLSLAKGARVCVVWGV